MSVRRVSVRAGELVVTAGDVAFEADVDRGAVVCVRARTASVGGACHLVAGRAEAACDTLAAHGVRVVRMIACGPAPRRLTFRVASGALEVHDR